MKDDNTFNEEVFRDAFSDFSPEPPKGMLDKVRDSQSRSKTSSSKNKWIAGASALLIISAIGVYNYKPTPTPETNKNTTEVHVTEVEDTPEAPIIEKVELISNQEEKTIKEESRLVIIEKVDTIHKTIIIEADGSSLENPDYDTDF